MYPENPAVQRKPFDLFRNRSYLSLILAQFVSNLGTHMHYLALMWLMNVITHGDTLYIALIAVAEMVPSIVFSPFAGVWVDRWNKLRTMWIVDLLSGIIVGGIAVAAYLDAMTPLLLLVLTFLLQSAIIFFNPAKQALLLRIVPSEQLMAANSYSQSVFTACYLGGPLVAGVCIGVFGPYLVFVFDALSYILSFLLLAFVKHREEASETEVSDGSFWQEAWEGFRMIGSISVLRYLFPISLVLNFLFAPLDLFIITKLDRVFEGEAAELGYVMSAFGVGMLAGSLTVGMISQRVRSKYIYFFGLTGSGLGLLGFALSTSLLTGVIAIAIAGYFNVYINIAFQTAIQKAVPEDRLGRVFAILGVSVEGLAPLSHLLFGMFLGFLAINPLLIVLSCAYLLTVGFAWTRKVLQQEL